MIIEGNVFFDIDSKVSNRAVELTQEGDVVVIDKQQAAQLIEVLQKWVAGGEVE